MIIKKIVSPTFSGSDVVKLLQKEENMKRTRVTSQP